MLEWFAIPPLVDHVLLELSTVISLSWLALHGMAHSFVELHKPLHHNKAVIHEEEDMHNQVKTIYQNVMPSSILISGFFVLDNLNSTFSGCSPACGFVLYFLKS